MRLTPPSTTAGALPRCGWSGSRPGWQNMIGSAASVPQAYLPPTIFTDPSENEGISLIFALRCSHVKREFLLYCLEYVWYIQTHVYHRCSQSQLSPWLRSPRRPLPSASVRRKSTSQSKE